MAVAWTKELFEAAYDLSAEPDGHPNTRPEIRLHYHRYVMYPEAVRRAQFFKDHFGLTAQSSVLVVGCGFGWTAEALNGMGVPTIGTDTSAYIQTNKALAEDADIIAEIAKTGLSSTAGEGLGHFNRLRGDGVRTRANVMNEDHGSAASRNRVKRAFASGAVTLAISEDVVTSLTDAECAQLRTALANYSVPICHFVTELANPNPPFGFNSKTLAQWKAMFPSDTVVADGLPYRVA